MPVKSNKLYIEGERIWEEDGYTVIIHNGKYHLSYQNSFRVMCTRNSFAMIMKAFDRTRKNLRRKNNVT